MTKVKKVKNQVDRNCIKCGTKILGGLDSIKLTLEDNSKAYYCPKCYARGKK